MSVLRGTAAPLGRRRLLALCWRAALVAALACAALKLVIVTAVSDNLRLYDFKHDLYGAIRDILHGHDPYRPALLDHLVAAKQAGIHRFSVPNKPPSILLALLPFGVLPEWLGGISFIALSAAAIFIALRLLGVRDWRCFALAFASYPVIEGLGLGNASPLLLLGAAVMWRWRERLWPPALAFAAIVLLKVFPWVLGAWFIMRRRLRSLAIAVLIAVVSTALAWAVIGFADLAQYPRMLAQLSKALQGTGPSLISFLAALGVTRSAAQVIALALAGALVLGAWRLAARPADEGSAFGMVVIAALIAAPYFWEHYTVLLFVPIALVSPRLSWVWFVPVLPDLVPAGNPQGLAYVGFWVLIQGLVALRVCWPRAASHSAVAAPALAISASSS